MECYEIGAVVRSARKKHGMTQEDLAFGICAVSTLSKIERGICNPKIATFEALMERMGELSGRCILLVGAQELQRQRIQEEIALAIRLGDRIHLVQQLELYRKLSGDNNRQEQQWLSLGEAVLLWWSVGEAADIELLLGRVLRMTEAGLSEVDFEEQTHLEECVETAHEADSEEPVTADDTEGRWNPVRGYTACEVLILQLLIACRGAQREMADDISQLHGMLEWLNAAGLELRWKKLACISIGYQLADLSFLMGEYPGSVKYCCDALLMCMQLGEFQFAPMLLSLLASGMTKRGDTKRAGKAKAFACAIDKMLAEKSSLLKFISDIL